MVEIAIDCAGLKAWRHLSFCWSENEYEIKNRKIKMKTAIVTGASGNLGHAVVRKLLSEGIKVIGTISPNETPANETDGLEKVSIDLTDEALAQQFVESVIVRHGNIDIAVLTVGGFAMGSIAETGSSDMLKQYKLNFETAYNIARPVFVQMMKQNSGRIFLIGSRPGMDAAKGKGLVAYGLGKSLIFRLAELMNQEAEGHDVVTSVIVPSTIDTPQNRRAMPDTNFANWVKAEDIADVIHYYTNENTRSLREPLIKVFGNS
jgi:NAD(P)-dependent dehydrogenase (short-subunit alcohol dehydrogenase family)